MKALILEITFFEAFFKVHYTKGFRQTYPIPLPTTTAGMFGSLLGLSQKECIKKFNDCLFGACIKGNMPIINAKSISECVEMATYIQYKMAKVELGAERLHILCEPSYYLGVASQDLQKLEEWKEKIENEPVFLPFGGQNDFFPKDWEIKGIFPVSEVEEKISNYLPEKFVKRIYNGSVFETLPVMFKPSKETSTFGNNLIFMFKGYVDSKRKINCVNIEDKRIALYPLHHFCLVGEWRKEK